jgi:hypothetical protein
MRNAISFLTVLLCAAFVGSSPAQEKKITSAKAKAAFDRADKALNAAWAEAKKTLPESAFNKLKDAQRAWGGASGLPGTFTAVHRCRGAGRTGAGFAG